MPFYTAESKERVRDVADFVEIVSARTELRRAGPSSFTGLCPFHDERTPSFSVEATAKVYYCFGCQAGGDLFTFVQETEGIEFSDTLELLADRYGVQLEREGGEDPGEAARRRRKERARELLTRTCDYYQRVLWESAEASRARDYLASRGLDSELLREFRVGYAPSAWDRVLVRSLRAGFSEDELRYVGLAQTSKESGRPYDRFRERIMFPLMDSRRGDVVGFGARAMRDNQQPKYLNTADNDVYHKGAHLYGANLAKPHAVRAGRVILCEGYTDVIAMHQAGLRETVGLMGTAMTVKQVAALPAAATVLLALDADAAGQDAMLRAAAAAARERRELRVVELPAGADPAELLARDGAQTMHEIVARSVAFARFRVQRVLDGGDDTSPEGRDRMLDQLRVEFKTVTAPAMRSELMRIVSGRLGLREGVTEGLLGGVAPAQATAAGARYTPARSAAARHAPAQAPLNRRAETERSFLALCLALPKDGRRALAALDIEAHFTSELVRRAARHLLAHRDAPAAAVPESDRELTALLAELTVRAQIETGDPQALEMESLQLELARIERAIASARADGRVEVAGLGVQRVAVKRALDSAYDRVLEHGRDP